jgi:altronate hydrolase
MQSSIRIHSDDNVAVALSPLEPATTIRQGETVVVIRSPIPRGHKFSLAEIEPGQPVVKYGFPIGRATQKISQGEWVHTHNLETALSDNVEYTYRPETHVREFTDQSLNPDPHEEFCRRTFLGYPRGTGKTGTRNEIWIVNTVSCVNNSAERIARIAHDRFAGKGVEGIYSFSHPYGCSQLGDDLKNTQRILAGLIKHPNAAGVFVLGLGCENNAIKSFVNEIGGYDPERVRFLNAQDVDDEIEEGFRIVEELVEYGGRFEREPRPISELVLGMKCGGSDGLSGITANPLVGRISEVVSGCGGTAILSEVPEMFGAEQILMNRARDETVFRLTVELINGFKDYYRRHGQPIYENPSPGNKDGGITTLEEKSLGAIQKGGRAMVTQVVDYGEQATEHGLVLLESPGNDGISSTAETVAGANLILFTTGRGTPLGVPAPTIKISTNTDLAMKKSRWIDFDAGVIGSGELSFDQAARDLFDLILKIASGQIQAKNEINCFREITIFKTGVTL